MNPSYSTYFDEYNGEKRERKITDNAAAFTTIKKQDYSDNKWTFENGIYYSDKSGEHTVIHELFHFFSMLEQIEFDENGIAFTKLGVDIAGWDREDNLVDRTYTADRIR